MAQGAFQLLHLPPEPYKGTKTKSIAPGDTAGPANRAENRRKSPILAVPIPWEPSSTPAFELGWHPRPDQRASDGHASQLLRIVDLRHGLHGVAGVRQRGLRRYQHEVG